MNTLFTFTCDDKKYNIVFKKNDQNFNITMTHYNEDGNKFTSLMIKLNHIDNLDSNTLEKWINLNKINVSENDDKIIITLKLKYIGTNIVVLNRVYYKDLLATYDTLKMKYEGLKNRYNELREEVDNICVGCLEDVGQGDYICRGEYVQEQINEICESYEFE